MEIRIGEAVVHYVERGRGLPLVALHGAGVDHREIEVAVEAVLPRAGWRRIYPDLPGMGSSSAGGLASNDDVVDLLGQFVDGLGAGPVALIGHSYGAHLARGLASRRPELVLGVALLCPMGEGSGDVPEQEVVLEDPAAEQELDPADRQGFEEYFVVRTPATARRYRDHVLPGTTMVDEGALERIFAGWTITRGPEPFTGPVLIVAGRRDSTAGFAPAIELLDDYPRAALAVLENAGHALMHERPELLAALLGDWLDRTRAGASTGP